MSWLTVKTYWYNLINPIHIKLTWNQTTTNIYQIDSGWRKEDMSKIGKQFYGSLKTLIKKFNAYHISHISLIWSSTWFVLVIINYFCNFKVCTQLPANLKSGSRAKHEKNYAVTWNRKGEAQFHVDCWQKLIKVSYI